MTQLIERRELDGAIIEDLCNENGWFATPITDDALAKLRRRASTINQSNTGFAARDFVEFAKVILDNSAVETVEIWPVAEVAEELANAAYSEFWEVEL